jgi:hypothetical protein
VEKGERKGYITERNEEAPENGKESSYSAHASGMNGAKLGLYGGCGKTIHINFLMASLVHRLTCSQALLCCSRTSALLLCGLSWHKYAWSFVNIVMCVAELMVVALGIMSKWSICISHDTVTITFPKELAISNVFLWRDTHMMPLYWLSLFLLWSSAAMFQLSLQCEQVVYLNLIHAKSSEEMFL